MWVQGPTNPICSHFPWFWTYGPHVLNNWNNPHVDSLIHRAIAIMVGRECGSSGNCSLWKYCHPNVMPLPGRILDNNAFSKDLKDCIGPYLHFWCVLCIDKCVRHEMDYCKLSRTAIVLVIGVEVVAFLLQEWTSFWFLACPYWRDYLLYEPVTPAGGSTPESPAPPSSPAPRQSRKPELVGGLSISGPPSASPVARDVAPTFLGLFAILASAAVKCPLHFLPIFKLYYLCFYSWILRVLYIF